MNEMQKLMDYLAQNKIPFEYRLHPMFKSTLQVCVPTVKNCMIDAVSFPGSYGGGQGLLELMFHDSPDDDVIGYLTGLEAADIIIQNWKPLD